MSKKGGQMAKASRQQLAIPCLCSTLRRASRAVSRLYDEELRGTGLRATRYALRNLL
jgi:hypothetical protein